jgi:phosphatidylethanolamine-binding protein (PEBP) family uncharacterized protein
MMKQIFLVFPLIFLILGCDKPQRSLNITVLKIGFHWTQNSSCAGASPPINVSDVPNSTKFLKAEMVDLDMPAVKHGGGEVQYTGSSVIDEGALSTYYGPCPLPGDVHSYEITVQALASDRQTVIGQGKAIQEYPN